MSMFKRTKCHTQSQSVKCSCLQDFLYRVMSTNLFSVTIFFAHVTERNIQLEKIQLAK